MTARNVILVYEYFKMLDFKNEGGIDDIQFAAFMMTATDLSILQIYQIFDMLDLDRSGSCEFDEFYLIVCILVAIKVNHN